MALDFGNMTSAATVFDLDDCRNAVETEYSVNNKSIAQSLQLYGGDIYVNSSRLSTVQEAVQALEDSFDEKQPKIPEEKLEAVRNVDAERRATLELLYPDGAVYYTSQQTAECPVQIADEEWHGPVQAANGLWMWGKEAEITSLMTTFVLADGTIEKYAIDGTISPQWMIDNGFYDGSAWIKDVKSVSLGIDVTEISAETFKGCSLSSIRLESQLSSIGNSAFYGCSSLTSVMIPDSVTSIGYRAFNGCSSLINVTIPDNVESIEFGTFAECKSLTSVTIPDGVMSIGYSAFYNCSGLKNMTMSDSVANIGNWVFQNCTSLTSVEFEGNAPTVGTDAFANVASGCKAIISSTATGFPAAGQTWNGLIVEVKS